MENFPSGELKPAAERRRAMEDRGIIALYWAREEQALAETERKYGRYCWTIAHHILRSPRDSEECVNDTWLRAWNAMPPQRPSILSSFLGKITRNLALDRYRAGHSGKRGGGQTELALEELSECLPGGADAESLVEAAELSRALDRFLRTLPERDCSLFLRRYWYLDSVREIADRYGVAEGTVKSSLHRTRGKLRNYLEEQGVRIG